MNVFGFLAVIIICGTIIGSIWLLTRKPISIRIIRTTEPPKVVNSNPIPSVELTKAIDTAPVTPVKNEIDKEVEITSMDAVIKAANELMGIETLNKEVNNDRKE